MSRQAALWPGAEPRETPPAIAALPARALTLWQPWAWLVANGHKDIENRPPGFSFKSFRGDFWIHAGLQVDPVQSALARKLALERGVTIPNLVGDDHFGCIVGRATITAILTPGPSGNFWHFPEQYGFKIVDARPVKPVRCRGYQGFWGVPADALEKLVEPT